MEEEKNMRGLEVQLMELEGIIMVKLNGTLDTNTSLKAEKVFKEVLAQGHNMILVNFELLDFISSAGLRVLLSTAKSLQGKGSVTLCNMNVEVREVLEMTGLVDLVFKVFHTEEEALDRLIND